MIPKSSEELRQQHLEAVDLHLLAAKWANTMREVRKITRKTRYRMDLEQELWQAHYEGFCAGFEHKNGEQK